MAAVGEAGADWFRPHFPAIEWDDMVDAFKSGAAVVNSGTFHTPAHPHVGCELPAASAMIYADLTKSLEAPHPERRPPDLTGYLQTPRQLPRPPDAARSGWTLLAPRLLAGRVDCSRLDQHLAHITPAPVFSGLEALDYGVLGSRGSAW